MQNASREEALMFSAGCVDQASMPMGFTLQPCPYKQYLGLCTEASPLLLTAECCDRGTIVACMFVCPCLSIPTSLYGYPAYCLGSRLKDTFLQSWHDFIAFQACLTGLLNLGIQ